MMKILLRLAQTFVARRARGDDQFPNSGLLEVLDRFERHVPMDFARAAQQLVCTRKGCSPRDSKLDSRFAQN